jgi:hypothetical protein
MKEIGIREMVRQVGEFADTHLMDEEECCAFVIDNDIVLCVKNKPAYFVTGVKFDVDTPKMLVTAGTNIINKLAFNLGPEEAYAIMASTMPKQNVHRRKKLQLAHSA